MSPLWPDCLMYGAPPLWWVVENLFCELLELPHFSAVFGFTGLGQKLTERRQIPNLAALLPLLLMPVGSTFLFKASQPLLIYLRHDGEGRKWDAFSRMETYLAPLRRWYKGYSPTPMLGGVMVDMELPLQTLSFFSRPHPDHWTTLTFRCPNAWIRCICMFKGFFMEFQLSDLWIWGEKQWHLLTLPWCCHHSLLLVISVVIEPMNRIWGKAFFNLLLYT